MAERLEYRLKIGAYTRETMPMKRLAEYLTDLAVLFGEEHSVHLIAIESGSTCPVVLVDREAEPKIVERLTRVRNNEGPEEAQRALLSIDTRLARDNASADLVGPSQGKIIEFPGARKPKPLEWPTINQSGELYGVPISVGGKTELANVHLLDRGREWICVSDRAKAIAIARHLYGSALRVTGHGRWRKTPSGWELERFVIEEFEPVKTNTIEKTIEELRSVQGAWTERDNPLALLHALRSGQDG